MYKEKAMQFDLHVVKHHCGKYLNNKFSVSAKLSFPKHEHICDKTLRVY